jgi:hypothetical protein
MLHYVGTEGMRVLARAEDGQLLELDVSEHECWQYLPPHLKTHHGAVERCLLPELFKRWERLTGWRVAPQLPKGLKSV